MNPETHETPALGAASCSAMKTKTRATRRSKHALVRRLKLAESVCQEVRYQMTSRVVDQDWSGVFKLLLKWMRSAPQEVRYSRPPNASASAMTEDQR